MASRRRPKERFAFASRAVHHPRLRRSPSLEVLEGRALLSTFTVNSFADAGSGSGDSGDLRYCINQANADDQANTIVFDSTVFGTPQTITLSGSQLELSDTGGTQTITGPAAGVTISGGGNSRVFQIDNDVTASLSGLTISDGSTLSGNGGGLANYGTATLTGCTLTGNSASAAVSYPTNSGGFGGGVLNAGTANLTLTDCTISGNFSSGGGDGGGVGNYGTATLTDCTVSGNSAYSGGGVDNQGAAILTLAGCTVSGNYTGEYGNGGGVYNSGTANLIDTIVAGNSNPFEASANDIWGTYVSGSYSLIGTGGSGGLATGVDGNIVLTSLTDLGLAPLGTYGGPTQTIALLPGSPAIGAGIAVSGVTTDQRGEPLDTPNPDIGAFQSQGFSLSLAAGSTPQTAAISTAFENPLALSVTANNPVEPVDGGVVSFVAPPLAGGASALLSASSAIIADGQASVTAEPDNLDGSYSVTASDTAAAPASFDLTNTGVEFPQLIVNTTSVAPLPGAGLLSLPEAMLLANDDVSGNANISFDPTAFSSPQTITLLGTQLELSNTSETETITGPAAGVTVSGGGTSRVFQVDAGVTASLSGLTISDGQALGIGGGLVNFGTATLTDCTSSDNTVVNTPQVGGYGGSANGGGVFNAGTAILTLTDCTFSGNSDAGDGGGGGVDNNGAASLTDCTFSDNNGTHGGGVSNSGTATLTDCTLSGNSSGYDGGGLANAGGTSTLIDCTLSGNTQDANFGLGGGGGVDNGGTVTLTGCTISGNAAALVGGGVYNTGTATLTDTIVAGNTNPSGSSDIAGTNVSGNYSLIGPGGSGGLTNGSNGNIVLTSLAGLGLAPLGNYGGPTQTMALLPGSPALGAGIAVSGITTDQRGEPLDSPNPDIGAYQFQSTTYSLVVTTEPPASVTAGTAFGLTVTAEDSSGNVDASFDGTVSLALGSGPSGSVLAGTLSVTAQSGVASFSNLALDEAGTGYTLQVSANGEPLANTASFNVTPAAATQLVVTTQPPGTVVTGDAFGLVVSALDQFGNVDSNFNGSVSVALLDNPGGATLGGTLSVAAQSGVSTFSGLTLTSAGAGYTLQVSSPGLTTATTGAFTVYAPTICTVDLTSADGTGSGNAGDLVYVVGLANANTNPGGSEIEFDPSVFSTPQTITLGATLELEETKGPEVIDGPGAGLVTVSGGGTVSVFGVDTLVTATISGLTISGGSAAAFGSGLDNFGTATLIGCTLSGNSIAGAPYGPSRGGTVFNYNSANLTLTDCTLSGNSAQSSGGGLENDGTAYLTDCTLSDNYGVDGGGVANFHGTISLNNCTVSGNSADNGGGLVNYYGTATLTDCTLSGNSAVGYGGGVLNLGALNLTLTACTLSGNSATYAGGLANYYGTATLTDTLVAGNTNPSGASDISANDDVSGSDNLIGTGGSGGLADGVDGNIVLTSLTNLGLAPLGNNGGPTQTMALLPGSSAIGAGVTADYPGTSTPITTDQRGEPLDAPNPDIGAFQTQPATLTTLSFSGISDQSITYGTSSVTISGTLASGSQAPVGETVAVTLDGQTQSATIGSGGAFSTTFNDDGLAVGSSPYTVSYAYSGNGTFASCSASSSLTINPATLTVTASALTKVYGTAEPALAYSVTGFEFSDTAASVLTGTLARAQAGTLAGEQAGGYAIGQGTLAANGNYRITFTGNTLTITPAPLTVTANSQTKLYGTADPALTDTATGFVDSTVDGVLIDDTTATALSGQLARTPGETVSGGPYAITQGTLAADSNYKITFTGSTLAITPAPLTVTANPQTKVYGTADPALTDTATGFVDTTVDGVAIDDTTATALSGQLARTAGETVSSGPYAITQGTLAADSNYTISFTGSALAITPAPLTVTANQETKVYGTADPALTDTATGLVDTTVDGVPIDDRAATALAGQLARTQGETVSGGPYAITQGTLAADSNYTISFTGSTLTISPAPLSVAANAQTKVYGTDDPALTDTATGFVDTTVDGVTIDDTAATVLTGALARAQSGTLAGEQAGDYAITQGTLAADSNYTISFTGSSLAITPAPLAVTANLQTKAYGTDDPALTVTLTGLVDTTVDGVAIADAAATVLTGPPVTRPS